MQPTQPQSSLPHATRRQCGAPLPAINALPRNPAPTPPVDRDLFFLLLLTMSIAYERTRKTYTPTTMRSNAPRPTTYMESPWKIARGQLFPCLPPCLSLARPPHANDTAGTRAWTTERSTAPRPAIDNGENKCAKAWVSLYPAFPERTSHSSHTPSLCKCHNASGAGPAKTTVDQIPAPQHPEAADIMRFLRAVITAHKAYDPPSLKFPCPRSHGGPTNPPTAGICGLGRAFAVRLAGTFAD